jgi:phage-related protein
MVSSEENKDWRIVFYTDRRGRSPVLEFLRGLDGHERAEAENAFRLLQEFGTLLSMPHARPITGHPKRWELRAGPNRVFYFAYVGRRFVMLHAYRKKGQKAPVREIVLAEKRMAEILEE